MKNVRKLPTREQVFIESLTWFGYKFVKRRVYLKFRRGYVIPSTRKEDSAGIDLWIKLPNQQKLYPVQLTQRGIRIFRLFSKPSKDSLAIFVEKSNQRIRDKAVRCQRDSIVFVLLRDYLGAHTNLTIAQRDLKSLLYGFRNKPYL